MFDNTFQNKLVILAQDERSNLRVEKFLEYELVQCRNQATKGHIEDEEYNFQQRK